MKKWNQSTGIFRRLLCGLLALVMVLGILPLNIVTAADGTTLYLVPNDNWKLDGARFAVYYWNNGGSGWTDMADADGDGVYEGTVPGGYSNIIFCRMNPNAAANDWNNKWNQTGDLTVPTDGTNCYTVAEGTWDNGGGSWSEIVAERIVYLIPNDNWKIDGARFAAYFFGNGEIWVGAADEDGDGVYEVVVPEGYPNVIFCRMNPNTTENNWNNKWNQTGDLTVPTDDNNCYTVPSGAWDGSNDSNWSVYPPEEDGGEEEPTATYVIAGSSPEIFGSAWDPSNTANTMDYDAAQGLYVKEYLNVEPGEYEFKVTDGTWNNSWGNNGGNYTFTVAELSNVTITFDAASCAITVEVEAVPAAEYYLYGWINGADIASNQHKFENGKLTFTFSQDSYVFVKDGDGASYMTDGWQGFETKSTVLGTGFANGDKLFVPAGEYEFTLVDNGDGTLTLSYVSTAEEVPASEYYLYGWINGADVSSNEHKFVDGKLTFTFNQDSYVFVKDNNGASYMTDGWLGNEVKSAVLGTGFATGDKLFVPAGEHEFTLVDNGDGTLTLSYGTEEVEPEPEIPEGWEVVTIHFLKPEAWGGTINAWVWNAGGALPGYEKYQTAWPGSPISASTAYPGFYDLVIAQEVAAPFNFIFNDGANQTADLTTGEVTDGTELWVVNGEVLTEAPDYTVNLHFQKPGNWQDSIHTYAWTDAGQMLGDWPGTAAAADAVNVGWFDQTVVVNNDAGFNFIFNDNSGNQTADLSTGALQVVTDLWIVNGQVLTEAPDGWFDAGRTVHVPGTFPGPSWDAASNQMTYDPELGLYVYTFENVPVGSYEFKIAINGSWGENYGAGGVKDGNNISVYVPSVQDVTVWYNDETHYAVTSVAYDVNADITLSGTGVPEDTKLTDPGLTGLFSVTVDLPAGTYTDLTITYGDFSYTFGEFTLSGDRAVTFYFDPAAYIAYHNGSDVKVDTTNIYYTTKDLAYKAPFGAVAVGEEVTFAIDTGVDASAVRLIVAGMPAVEMVKDGEAVDGVQKWTCTTTFASLGEYKYYFAISNGSDLIFYCDDNYNNYYKKGDYGTGTTRDLANVFAYDLVVYEDGFETPDWMKDAVIYQIFPDRFFDGDLSNNVAQEHARGEVNYEYVEDWYLLPENPEQIAESNYPTYAFKGDGQWSNEIYGGDLKGIVEKIDYLKALGVNVIYLNPVFSSISNHRYDACDYTVIDPILGTLGDFEELVAVAEANDMHIILDGVFNHVSDDSVYFDRYYRFLGTSEKIGAYPYWAYVYDLMNEEGMTQNDAETAAKAFFGENYGITDYAYTEWFAVQNTLGTGVDNVGLRAGKNVYTYEGWWGYDSMPVIKSTNGSEFQTGNWAEEIIYNEDGSSVTQYWISKGNNGWRLDVANEVSDETWQNFRDSVKALDSDAVIIGEIWADATRYLMGDMYDSVMNYIFRDAVAGFARGYLINRDNKAEQYDADLTADEAMTILEILRERYPEEAFYAMMNLVGSHDTARILSYLDDVEDDRYQKDMANAFPMYETTSDRAKQLQYVVAFLQFTYAGAPTIYYGDEIGMVGGDDPDDRRTFEWGVEAEGKRELVEWYASMAAVREAYPALRTGSVEAFSSGNADVMSFVRRDSADALIVLANRAASESVITLDLDALNIEGETLTDLITGETFTAENGTVTVSVDAYRGAVLTAGEVKAVTVNFEDLKDAYDPAYKVDNEARKVENLPTARYEIVAGADQTTDGSEDLSVVIDAVINTFLHVEVNGEELAEDCYTVQTGVEVTLTAEYLASLEPGTYTLTVYFNGGYAETTFTVAEELPDVTDPEETVPEETAPEETEPEEEPTKPTEKPGTDDDSANTGDETNIGIFAALLAISLAGIAALAVIFLKKRNHIV